MLSATWTPRQQDDVGDVANRRPSPHKGESDAFSHVSIGQELPISHFRGRGERWGKMETCEFYCFLDYEVLAFN